MFKELLWASLRGSPPSCSSKTMFTNSKALIRWENKEKSWWRQREKWEFEFLPQSASMKGHLNNTEAFFKMWNLVDWSSLTFSTAAQTQRCAETWTAVAAEIREQVSFLMSGSVQEMETKTALSSAPPSTGSYSERVQRRQSSDMGSQRKHIVLD